MKTEEIRGQWDQIRGKIRSKWGQLTDDDLQLAQGNVEQMIGRIQQKTGETRRNVEHYLDQLVADGGSMLHRAKDAALDMANTAATSARDGLDTAQRQAARGYRQAEDLVRRHPAESLVTMFGLGCIVGFVVGWIVAADE